MWDSFDLHRALLTFWSCCSPVELARMVHSLFSEFDDAVVGRNLFKVDVSTAEEERARTCARERARTCACERARTCAGERARAREEFMGVWP